MTRSIFDQNRVSDEEGLNKLPAELRVEIIRKMSLRDLLVMWSTAKTTQALINRDPVLLQRLGVKSFEEFIARVNAFAAKQNQGMYDFVDSISQDNSSGRVFMMPEGYKRLLRAVLDEEIHIFTAEALLLNPSDRFERIISKEQNEQLKEWNITRQMMNWLFESNELVIAFYEKLITLEDIHKLIVLSINIGSEAPGFDLFCKNGLKALREGIITVDEANSMNKDILEGLKEDESLLIILRKRHQYLMGTACWEAAGVSSREELQQRVDALPIEFQINIFDREIALKVAEQVQTRFQQLSPIEQANVLRTNVNERVLLLAARPEEFQALLTKITLGKIIQKATSSAEKAGGSVSPQAKK